jgi:hypothetical protein
MVHPLFLCNFVALYQFTEAVEEPKHKLNIWKENRKHVTLHFKVLLNINLKQQINGKSRTTFTFRPL